MNKRGLLAFVILFAVLSGGCSPSISKLGGNQAIDIPPTADLSMYRNQAVNSANGSIDHSAGNVNSTF